MQVLQLFDVAVQLLLLLLNSLVVHLVEVPLLQQFVVSRLGFLGNYHCLVELALEPLDLLPQGFVLDVGVRYLSKIVRLASFLHDFIPLLLR